MTFYISITIITEILMLTMIFHVIGYSGFVKGQKTWYIFTFGCIMFCSAAECLVHCGYYDPKFKIILTLVTIIQFSLAPLLGILFIGALGLKNQRKIGIVFLIMSFIVEVVCAPFKAIFYFNDEGYFRGEFFFIYSIFFFASLVYLIVCMFIVGRRFKKRDFSTILMILAILISGILPMAINKLNVAYLAIAVSSCLCYIYYNDLVQQDIKTELINNQEKMTSMQTHMISGLANVIENRDMDTGEHIVRTSMLVRMLSEYARIDGVYVEEIDDRFIDLIYTLAPMHDVGKIIIPDNILKKPGRLTDEEFETMKKHAEVGGDVVKEVLSGITDEQYLSFAADLSTYHHEWWNGLGYPKGLRCEEIPLCARIMAIADVYDALISERCYKKAMKPEDAFRIIEEESGTHFDPKLVKVFLNHKKEFKNIDKE
ncbi:MAG: HD domain-containing protein [bacterium]|nr:HD domain-containing protein [bacterium]